MRHLLRALLTSAFVASLAVGAMAGVASAAPGGGNGTSFELYEDLCINDPVDETVWYCFEVHGRSTVVDQNDGDQVVTTAARTVFYVVDDGVAVAATIDHSVSQSKLVDGVFEAELAIAQTRTLTPGQQCVAHLLLRIEGGEVVVDQASMSCT